VQAAAEALHVTPSGISHRIASLQRKIGATLLLRQGRGVALSAVAMDYVAAVREGLAGLSMSTAALREGEHGVVRITTAAAVGASWLLPLLKRFSDDHVDARFEIATVASADELPADRWDLLIHYGVPRRHGTQRRPLVADQLVTVCAPGLLKGRSRSLTRRQLDTLPTLRLLQLESPRGTPRSASALPLAGAQLVFDDAVAMLEAAASGAGVAVTTETAARPYLDAGRLVRATGESRPGQKYFIDLSQSGQFKPTAVSLFDWLVQQSSRP
jgi:LysR family glycine cleavage system transcriptional activator